MRQIDLVIMEMVHNEKIINKNLSANLNNTKKIIKQNIGKGGILHYLDLPVNK